MRAIDPLVIEDMRKVFDAPFSIQEFTDALHS
jgi:hypothetical protein